MAFGQAINAASTSGTVNTLSSTGIATTSGELLCIGIEIGGVQTITIGDTYNNTWIPGPTNVAGGVTLYSYYAQNITGGPGHVFTINVISGPVNMNFIVVTATGRATSSALDQSATWINTGFTTDHPHTAANFTGTAAVTTGFAGEDVFAFNCSMGATAADVFTAGSGWTIPTNGSNLGNGTTYAPSMLQYQAGVAIGTYTDNYTTGNFVRGGGVIMSFRAASGGGSAGGLMLSLLGVG